MKNKKQKRVRAFAWTAAVGLSTLALAATAFATTTTANNAKASNLDGRYNDITRYITIQYKTTHADVHMSGSRFAKIKTTEPFRVANRPSVTQAGYSLVGWTTIEDDDTTLVAETQKFESDQVFYPLMRPVGQAVIDGPKLVFASLSGYGILDDKYDVEPPTGAEDHDFIWEISGDAQTAGCTWDSDTSSAHGQSGKIIAPAYSGDQVLTGTLTATDIITSQTTEFNFFLCPPYICPTLEMPMLWWKNTDTERGDEWLVAPIDLREGEDFGLVGTSDPDTPIMGASFPAEMEMVQYTRTAGEPTSFNPEKVYIGSTVEDIPEQFMCNIASMTDTEVVVPSMSNVTGIDQVEDYVDLQNVRGISSSFMQGNENWNGVIPNGLAWGDHLDYIGNYFLDGCTEFDGTGGDGGTFTLPAALLIGDACANGTAIKSAALHSRTAEVARNLLSACPELTDVTFLDKEKDDDPWLGLLYVGSNCLYNDKALTQITFNCDGNAFEVCDGSFAWNNQEEGTDRTEAINISGSGAGVIAENFENHLIPDYEAYRNLSSPVVINTENKNTDAGNVITVSPTQYDPGNVPDKIVLSIVAEQVGSWKFNDAVDAWQITLNEVPMEYSSDYTIALSDENHVATITILDKTAFAAGTNLHILYDTAEVV